MKTRVIIEIETSKMKKYVDGGEDLTDEMEKEWHNQIFNFIEESIHDDDLEGSLMSNWYREGEYLNPSAKEFLHLGNLTISIHHEV